MLCGLWYGLWWLMHESEGLVETTTYREGLNIRRKLCHDRQIQTVLFGRPHYPPFSCHRNVFARLLKLLLRPHPSPQFGSFFYEPNGGFFSLRPVWVTGLCSKGSRERDDLEEEKLRGSREELKLAENEEMHFFFSSVRVMR